MSSPVPRWSALVTVGPYALLAILIGVTVASKRSQGESPLIDLALCALAAAWMLWVFTLHPAWRERPPVMAVFFTVLIVIMSVLVIRNPWFGFFTPAGYVYAFRVLRWPWEVAGVAAVALVSGTAQAYGIDKTTWIGLVAYAAVVVANIVPMCGFAWFARRSALQNDERERALQEVREANRRLAATLAENAALHEQLLAQAREAGVHDERQRMAREIHDTLAQGLTGIVSQLRAAAHTGEDPAGWRRHIEAATTLARESLAEARRSVHALRPEPLQSARLSEAVAGVAERWSALHEIPVQVTTTGTARPLLPEAEVTLLRTAQEALANVAKHARATRVGVTLSYMDHEVALDVRDDGDGFDPARLGDDAAGALRADHGGFGLVAMRQRIEGLSGTLQIESEPGIGTGISARVPAERAGVCA
ncbi:sensor histidine kinase [Nonomuraea sp. NPDC005983]|uniref:sensor histidine kinase n=1 Tax=Nonomuraea sp. NPDC005983 TaxID=3155595 RepID=UPI0033A7CABA